MTTMTKTETTTQTYRVFIKATPEAIWDALTKAEWAERYGYGGRIEYDRVRDRGGPEWQRSRSYTTWRARRAPRRWSPARSRALGAAGASCRALSRRCSRPAGRSRASRSCFSG